MGTTRQDSYRYESEGSTDDDDIPVLQPIPVLRQSVFGQIRTCGNVSWLEWSFIALSVINIITNCAINIYRMFTLPTSSDEYVFAILVLVNLFFCVWYLLHGIFQEQPFEILMFVLTSLLLSFLITLNYATKDDSDHANNTTSEHLKLIRFIVTLVLTVPNAVIGLKVGWSYWSSGNLVFKTVGADMRLQRMCRAMFFGMSLLVFDAQAFVSCLILIIERGISDMTDEDVLIITTGLAFIVLWVVIGYLAIRKESMHLAWLFFVSSIVQPVYCIFLLVNGLQEIMERYSTIRTDSVFVAGIALVAAHFSLLALFIVIVGNFGKGLRASVYGNEEFQPVIHPESGIATNYGTTP